MRSKKPVSLLCFIPLAIFIISTLISCGGSGGGGGSDPQDQTPPSWSSGYPSVNISDTNFYLKVSIEVKGRVYCVILPEADAAPSPEQVKAGEKASGDAAPFSASRAVEGKTPYIIKVTGRVPTTAYKAYFVAENTASALQETVEDVAVPAVYMDTLFVAISGDDANNGSSENPKKTITDALGAATEHIREIWVSAGTYNESVLINKTVNLLGGFSATDWSDRDPNARGNVNYKTFISGIASSNYGVRLERPVTLEGFWIAGKYNDNQSNGVFVDVAENEAGYTGYIRWNTIKSSSSGNANSGVSSGIRINRFNGKLNISSNDISGSDDKLCWESNGIYIFSTITDSSSFDIAGNKIDGGYSSFNSYGIEILGLLTRTSRIVRNDIFGGTSDKRVYGISLFNGGPSDVLIYENDVRAINYVGTSNSQSVWGIYVSGQGGSPKMEPMIFNNTIQAITDNNFGYGVYFNEVGGSPKVYNNTIVVAGISQFYGIYAVANADISKTNADIRNNIIICSSDIEDRIGLYEHGARSFFSKLENNDFFGFKYIVKRGGTGYDNITEVNNLTDAFGNVGNASGNVDDDPKLSASPDYYFTAESPVSVTQGGMDLTGDLSDAGYDGEIVDKMGNPRTAPWSMGAYELD